MSKKALARQRGWIDFNGLRHASKFMNRSEPIEFIIMFFQEHGVNPTNLQHTLHIEFRLDRDPRGQDNMSVAGYMCYDTFGIIERVVVYIRMCPTRAIFINVLAHELDHCVWAIQKLPWDHSTQYWDRTHEVRARQTGNAYELRYSHK